MPTFAGSDPKPPETKEQPPDFGLLQAGLEHMGKTLTADQKNSISKHFSLMEETNKVMNLTTVTTWEMALTRHFLDSLSVFLAFETLPMRDPPQRLLDIGSGAGFPGIPIKIFCPNIQVDLVESRKKKAAFLEKVVTFLDLHPTKVYAERAESLAHSSLRESYDIVVSRAVAPMNILAELALPFVRIGGVFVAMKQLNILDELHQSLAAIKKLGGMITAPPLEVDLPNLSPKRSLVVVSKTQRSPIELPRTPGIPQKKPLR